MTHKQFRPCGLLAALFLIGACTPINHLEAAADPARARPAADSALGANEALRVYTEFADGRNRGMYDPATGDKGFPDEDFDGTTSIVINWHRMPEVDPRLDARLRYRRIHPSSSEWSVVEGISREFWTRKERVNRVLITGLEPNSVYEFQVRKNGRLFRFRTMPAHLEQRTVKIVMTGDHQRPEWSDIAHANARMAALQKPDMFVVAGDFVNDEGDVTADNAERWVNYLDILYGVENGYFFYPDEIDGELFDNLIIPHLSIVGNHEVGEEHHIRWPADPVTGSTEPGYPGYTASNWTELLFHWPYQSEGFRCEYHSGHPNVTGHREGFGHGGFGKLSFGDYFMLIALDNCCQNWAGEPDIGLRDWKGDLITETWPWFETHHADIRQDLWLKNLMEPDGGPSAGEVYRHMIAVYHRGLFGTVRLNMSLKNRDLLKYWLPVLHRNGVKLIKEAHDHIYTRTVPMGVSDRPPPNTRIEKIPYGPRSWTLTEDLPKEYLERFYTVNALKDNDTGEIVGWEYEGQYITYDPAGFVVQGHGGWAAGRRRAGARGAGNAGLWFVDESKGGATIEGDASYHLTTVRLTPDTMTVETYHPDQLPRLEWGAEPVPIHRRQWDRNRKQWKTLYAEPAGR